MVTIMTIFLQPFRGEEGVWRFLVSPKDGFWTTLFWLNLFEVKYFPSGAGDRVDVSRSIGTPITTPRPPGGTEQTYADRSRPLLGSGDSSWARVCAPGERGIASDHAPMLDGN